MPLSTYTMDMMKLNQYRNDVWYHVSTCQTNTSDAADEVRNKVGANGTE